MSELKVTTVYDAYWKANSTGEGTGILVYLKSEADKVIADLIEKNKRLANKDMIMASETIKGVFDVLRRYKYKHCLDMAYKCVVLCQKYKDRYRWAEDENLEHYYNHKIEFFARWHNRWLGLAEQFKEAK